MNRKNKTVVDNIILLAFNEFQQTHKAFFVLFLMIYITCILENLTIIALVRTGRSLHSPMYFFISVFATSEIMFVSVTIPKLMSILIAANNRISFAGCVTQMYFLNSLGTTECYLLVVMMFDRYMAINNPLHYQAVMTPRFCVGLALFSWIFGFSILLITTCIIADLEFCGPNVIDHFFCDMAPLQSLACSKTFVSSISVAGTVVICVVLPFLMILGFYIQILKTTAKIKNKAGKQKAFSTCSSHLIVCGFFFGAATIAFVKTKSSHYDKYFSFMYTAFTPVINPFIYTFRNREVKKVLWNLTPLGSIQFIR